MKNSELKTEYLTDENTFWHITSKLNLESIKEKGLIPHDGNRDGENVSKEDPVPRVFFSYGLEGVLEQANNTARIVNDIMKKELEQANNTNERIDRKNVKEKMQNFLNRPVNTAIEGQNGGFIDIINFIKDDIFKNGINKNITNDELNKVTYDIVKTLWENDICLKANLKENVDYSRNDVNYTAKGKPTSMTKKNMHAFEGHTIASDMIEVITDENDNPRTTWDVFKEMAQFYKDKNPEKGYLPVDKWEYETGEIGHMPDYLSMFIKMEKEELAKDNEVTQNGNQTTSAEDIAENNENEEISAEIIAKNIANDDEVAKKMKEAKSFFKELENKNEHNQDNQEVPNL